MGTRGLCGFVIDNETKAMYNHYDSYPSVLGENIKNVIVSNDINVLIKTARKIKMVKNDETPTKSQMIKYSEFKDSQVNSGNGYYSLLRKLQGNIYEYINNNNADIMIDGINFINNSLFCEWAYLINLDTMMLEIYKGSQTSIPSKNRYFDIEMIDKYYDCEIINKYYGCEMIREIPFNKVLNFSMKSLEETMI